MGTAKEMCPGYETIANSHIAISSHMNELLQSNSPLFTRENRNYNEDLKQPFSGKK